MSETLGEKLRQAREEKGYTISEVSENTRISPLYLESIENNDYSILPGGIFNKGFVKSYAKFVGIDEQEALLEYSRLISATQEPGEDEVRRYKPEVLTDDGNRSMVPTVIVALLVLGIMSAAILFGLNYLRQPDTDAINTIKPAKLNSSNVEVEPTEDKTVGDVPAMETIKVEFSATTEPVSLSATTDGKFSTSVVAPGTTADFEPKTALKLSYSKSLASVVRLTINGKAINLPAEPLVPRRKSIEFEINKDNLADIWTSGAIPGAVPAANVAEEANTASPSESTRPTALPRTTPPAATVATPQPKPSAPAREVPKPPAGNTAPKPAPSKPL